MSTQPEVNLQVNKKDYTHVDKNPGLKFQDTKKPLLVIKNSMNLIKGEAGGLSNPKRGQAINCCEQIVNEIVIFSINKRDKK